MRLQLSASIAARWQTALKALLIGAALAAPGPIWAIDPALDIRQLHHTSWTARDGAPDNIRAIAQTPDGYLWLGTQTGVYRFDGLTFEHIGVAGRDATQEDQVEALQTTRSGDLWVGYISGRVAMLRAGDRTFRAMGVLPGAVAGFAESDDGTILASVRWGPSALYRLAGGTWVDDDPARQLPKRTVSAPFIGTDGVLWIAAGRRIFIRGRATRRFTMAPELVDTDNPFAADATGRVWYADAFNGVRRLPDYARLGQSGVAPPKVISTHSVQNQLAIDSDAGVWGTSDESGLFRIARPAPDAWRKGRAPDGAITRFRARDGLTSDTATAVLEDTEHDIWVATSNGLDRFRAASIVPEIGVPARSRLGYIIKAARDGTIYLADSDTVYRVPAGGTARPILTHINNPEAICEAPDQSVWIASHHGLYRYADRVARLVMPPPGFEDSYDCMTDAHGGLWFMGSEGHLHLWKDRAWSTFDVLAGGYPGVMGIDRADRIVLGTIKGLAIFVQGRLRTMLSNERIPVGRVHVIYQGPTDLLLGGAAGLARLRGNAVEALPGQPSWLRSIRGIAQTEDGMTWIQMSSLLVRVPTAQLTATFDHQPVAWTPAFFDYRDGLRPLTGSAAANSLALGGDGRVWVQSTDALQWIDADDGTRPAPGPPTVFIKAVSAGGTSYAPEREIDIRTGVNALQIDYNAVSLARPDAVRFRYRLVGFDRGWIDAGQRRQAFYTNLPPGVYSFQVASALGTGAWRSGSDTEIRIPAQFWQTWTFSAACALLLLAFAWAGYQRRVHTVRLRLQRRFGDQMAERERIARELHDTLLQGIQGLIYKIQATARRLSPHLPERLSLEHALDEADAILATARQQVAGLRVSQTSDSLPDALARCAAQALAGEDVETRITTLGVPQSINPVIAGEIERIGGEASANVRHHAQASRLDVTIEYQRLVLKVTWADDGLGIAPEILAQGGKRGHFGLTGMRERARDIGGVLIVRNAPGGGTSVHLKVPGRIAYRKHPRAWHVWRRRQT